MLSNVANTENKSNLARWAFYLSLVGIGALVLYAIFDAFTPFSSICGIDNYAEQSRYLSWAIRLTGVIKGTLGLIIFIGSFSPFPGIAAIIEIAIFQPRRKGIVRAILAVLIGGIVLMCFLSNTIFKIQGRTKQSEARQNLGAIYTAEVFYYSEHGKYTDDPEELGWEPKGYTRYSYWLSESKVIPAYDELHCTKLEGECSIHSPFKPFVKEQSFQILAVGNIDADEVLDVWLVNERKEIKIINNDVFCDSWDQIDHPDFLREYKKRVKIELDYLVRYRIWL